MHQLIAESPPLDTNSVYCNLLQCAHFADTSVLARAGEGIVGFISGYRIPARTEVLFVWQVVVSAQARGQGLASRMLQTLLESNACRGVSYIETSITGDHQPSQALFQKLADRLGAPVSVSTLFDQDIHFGGQHKTERLYRIGPLQPGP